MIAKISSKLFWFLRHMSLFRGSVLRMSANGVMDRYPHGGPIELFLVPANTGVTNAMVCRVLSVGLLLIRNPCGGSGFLLSLNGPLPYVRHHVSVVVRAFIHGVMGRRIDPSWWTLELFLFSASAPRLGVTKAVVCVTLSVG